MGSPLTRNKLSQETSKEERLNRCFGDSALVVCRRVAVQYAVVFSNSALILVLAPFVSRAGYEMALIHGFQSRLFTFGFLALPLSGLAVRCRQFC
jgi:hypothetical protein